jgi:hypothetical protein
MKVIISSIFLLSAISSQAVIVAVSSLFGTGPYTVTDSADALIPQSGGYVGVGYFLSVADVDLPSTDPSVLGTDFALFGSSTTFGAAGFDGLYDFSSDGGRVGAASPFFGQSLYTLLGNGATIANSTDFVIFKHTVTFPDDSAAALPADLNAYLGTDGSFILGSITGDTFDYGGGNVVPIVKMEAIPEPSALLLSAFGILGLLRRKR